MNECRNSLISDHVKHSSFNLLNFTLHFSARFSPCQDLHSLFIFTDRWTSLAIFSKYKSMTTFTFQFDSADDQKVIDDAPPGGARTLTEVPLTLFPKASVTVEVPSATRLTSPTTPPVSPVEAAAA